MERIFHFPPSEKIDTNLNVLCQRIVFHQELYGTEVTIRFQI